MRYLIIVLSLFLITCGGSGGSSAPTDSGEENTDNENPSITVTGIDNNTSVNGQVSINVSATDNVGILKVEFYVNNQLASTITSVPYVYNWDTTTIIDGIYPLKIKAYDTSLNTSEQNFLVNVDNNFNGTFERVLKISTEGSDAIGYSIMEDDGGYVFVGHASEHVETSNTANDVFIIKLDVRGNIISQNKSDIGAYDFPRDFIKADDGGYVIVGETYINQGNSGDRVDAFMLKTDNEGIMEWKQTYDSNSSGGGDIAFTIYQSGSNYKVGAGLGSSGSYGPVASLIETDLSGSLVSELTTNYTHGLTVGYYCFVYNWDKFSNYSPMMSLTNDGGYIFGGMIHDSNASTYQLKLVRLGSDGKTLQWANIYGGGSPGWIGKVTLEASDGTILLAGHHSTVSYTHGDVVLLKTDSTGNQLWLHKYDTSGTINSIYETNDGGYVLAGYTTATATGNRDVYILKTDSNGNELWSKTFGGDYNDSAMNIKQTSDGGYIIVGCYGENNGDVSDVLSFYVLRTDYDGNVE